MDRKKIQTGLKMDPINIFSVQIMSRTLLLQRPKIKGVLPCSKEHRIMKQCKSKMAE